MIWLMFFLGQLVHLAAQVDKIARAENTPVTDRSQILQERLIPIAVRVFACTIAFAVLFGGGAPELFKIFGIEPWSWLVGLSGLLANTSPVGKAIAAALGFGMDSALTYIPKLDTYIPPPIDRQEIIKKKAFVKGVDATKEEVKKAVEEIKPEPPTGG